MLSANEIHSLCIRNFVYTPDREQYELREHWTSHEHSVRLGETWRDDCDGFALTAAVIALHEGYHPYDIEIAFVRTETGGGHLVCLVEGEMIDNRQRSAVPVSFVDYEWIKGMRMDDKIWREYRT